jgi:uncharacterized protein (TIGR00645 family)
MSKVLTKRLGDAIFAVRWILYPINIGLVVALMLYVVAFLYNDYHFIRHEFTWSMEALMVVLLGFVDASMVANLIVMVVQGTQRIFIHRFEISDKSERPQWLDHIDSGILKVKIASSIAGITLIQILKDFVHVESIDWTVTEHRIVIHVVALFSALMMTLIWRVTHPAWAADHVAEDEGPYDHSGRRLV